MAPKKVKSSKVSKVAKAMKKKTEVESFNKRAPLLVLDPPTTDVGAVSKFVNVERGLLSPSTEPNRKRL
ncbi:hypothetical protein JCGZ_06443 [Jatropha curcas]|uniref:Uncharacterized protein n=1 Tax=Jatropha curcas TaxID=180498 RepID=A0A067L113_JATCU|nr:hypothetical protein JCGZ_06443 [Jatropha curcas]